MNRSTNQTKVDNAANSEYQNIKIVFDKTLNK